MSSNDLKTSIDHLLACKDAANKLMTCLHMLDDIESIGLLGQIRERLADAEDKIEKSLPDYMFDGGVQFAAVRLGVSLAHIFPAHLDRMLAHKDFEIRLAGVRCGALSVDQLEKALLDEDGWVKKAAQQRVGNGNVPLTQKNQKIGLESVARIPDAAR